MLRKCDVDVLRASAQCHDIDRLRTCGVCRLGDRVCALLPSERLCAHQQMRRSGDAAQRIPGAFADRMSAYSSPFRVESASRLL
jgi:hypothetical protein